MSDWATRLVMGAAFGGAIALGMSFFDGVAYRDATIQAQETPEAADARVTEEELQAYIDVYTSMQADRTLKIDGAVAAQHMTVPDFRRIERRVQAQRRLVQRVREAMLEQAKQNATSLTASGVPFHN